MVLTIAEDVATITTTAGSVATYLFSVVADLADLVMGNALLLIPVCVIVIYTGIKVFKMIF